MKSEELSGILDYIYNGEVRIFENEIERFLDIAQRFQLDGLIGNDSADQESGFKEQNMYEDQNYKAVESFETNDLDETSSNEDVEKKIAIPRQYQNNTENRVIAGTLTSIEELNQKIAENLGKDENGKHCCNICGQTSKHSGHIKEHIETHFEGLSFPCPQCPYIGMRHHINRMHKM